MHGLDSSEQRVPALQIKNSQNPLKHLQEQEGSPLVHLGEQEPSRETGQLIKIHLPISASSEHYLLLKSHILRLFIATGTS